MIRRERVHALVVAMLQVSNEPPRARDLYSNLSQQAPRVMREERVFSFKGFVKVLNSFPEVKQVGDGVKKYAVEKTLK